MKTFITSITIIALLLFPLTGCRRPDIEQVKEPSSPGAGTADPGQAEASLEPSGPWNGTVVETMDSGGYTYVKLETADETIWAAAPKATVAVGDKVTIPPGMPMENYHSQTLDRDFDVVYFVSAILSGDAALSGPPPAAAAGPSPAAGEAAPAEIDFSGLEKPEGGYTVAEIFSGKEGLAGQKIAIRGIVVKFSSKIMGKNWIHLQDGTDHEGANDLTITTLQAAQKGDTVLVGGVLVTDKDFGAGYRYDVIVEDAEVTVE